MGNDGAFVPIFLRGEGEVDGCGSFEISGG